VGCRGMGAPGSDDQGKWSARSSARVREWSGRASG
jgi:hypothetical protein